MSVPKGERRESELKVLDLALNLAKHTATKAKNEKIFPKAQRWIVANRLVESAFSAYENIRAANEVFVKDNPVYADAYRIRQGYQIKALASLTKLMGDLDIAYRLYSLSGKELDYWSGLCADTRKALKSWIESDRRRFLHLLG